jgi:hypothetical protein
MDTYEVRRILYLLLLFCSILCVEELTPPPSSSVFLWWWWWWWWCTAQAGLAYPAKDMLKPELAEKLTARAQQREGIL